MLETTLETIDVRDFAVTVWIMTGDLTGALVAEARDWLSDCYWSDMEADEIAELSSITVQRAIAQHYSGGIGQFVADGS
jgi:hypothetical protein